MKPVPVQSTMLTTVLTIPTANFFNLDSAIKPRIATST